MQASKIDKKAFIPPILLGVLFILSIVAHGMSSSVNAANVEPLVAKVKQTRNKIEVKKADLKKEEKVAVSDATGLNTDRVNKDNKVVKDFLSTVFTWKNYNEYDAAREKVKEEMRLTEDSSFLKVFMPKLKNNIEGDESYNLIDQKHLNMSYEGFTPYVKSISGSNYNYFTLVEVVSTRDLDNDGTPDGEGRGWVIMEYMVDADGKIQNLTANLLPKF